MEQLINIISAVSWNLFSFIILLSIIVFVHEMGHFLVARFYKVKCEVFSVGFGPELFGFNDSYDTRWKFCIIPLGGYVKMFGEGDAVNSTASNNENEDLTEEQKSKSFKFKPLYQRSLIVFAGPAINFILAVLLYFILNIYGVYQLKPIVGSVQGNMPATISGIEVGDEIISINGESVESFSDLPRIINYTPSDVLEVSILRGNSVIYKTIIPEIVIDITPAGKEISTKKLGIGPDYESRIIKRELNPIIAFINAVKQTLSLTLNILFFLGQAFQGNISLDQFGSIPSIGKYAGLAASSGLVSFLSFMAILSINLGIINLLPIPLLDGGHLLFYTLEAILGKPLPEYIQEWSYRFGLVFLLGFMIIILTKDLPTFLSWGSF